MLLLLPIGVSESGLFVELRDRSISRGNPRLLVNAPRRLARYLCIVLVALPIWYAIGILVTFSPELGGALGLAPPPSAGRAVLYFFGTLDETYGRDLDFIQE